MTSKYPEIFNLFQAEMNKSWQWAVGDELLKVCGPPPKSGVNDGGYAVMELIKKDLEDNGIEIECDVKYLGMMRKVAHSFSAVKRFTALAWSVHYIAETPEALNKIKDKLESEGKKLTTRNAAKALTQIKTTAAVFPEMQANIATIRSNGIKLKTKIEEYLAIMPPDVMAVMAEECLSAAEEFRELGRLLGKDRPHILAVRS